MIQLMGRRYNWMTQKLSKLLKNIYLQSSFSLLTTVFPSAKVQTAPRKAIKSICNLITLLVLVWWTGIFCQTFLALCSAAGYGVAFKIGRFPGQTSLCTQQSLRTQPGYEVPNDLQVEFPTWVINTGREERDCLVASGSKLAFGQPNEN